jgi:hypothetical protein
MHADPEKCRPGNKMIATRPLWSDAGILVFSGRLKKQYSVKTARRKTIAGILMYYRIPSCQVPAGVGVQRGNMGLKCDGDL